MQIARAFTQRAKLDEVINEIKPALGPDVVRLQYRLGEDWSGDPAIFFQVVLSDEASRRDQLYRVTNQIKHTILARLQPLEDWDILDYFSFRSQAENAALNDERWV